MREIGDLQEVAKELLSAVNQGYLGGACRIASVAVGKSMLAMERQMARLIELSKVGTRSRLVARNVACGVLDQWAQIHRVASGARVIAVWDAIWEAVRLWMKWTCVEYLFVVDKCCEGLIFICRLAEPLGAPFHFWPANL